MPTVDFTLEDIARQTEHIVERALIKEREHTRAMIQESGEIIKTDLKQFITRQFLSFWEDNLAPAFEDLHNEFAETKDHFGRIIDQYSKGIMELRARRT